MADPRVSLVARNNVGTDHRGIEGVSEFLKFEILAMTLDSVFAYSVAAGLFYTVLTSQHNPIPYDPHDLTFVSDSFEWVNSTNADSVTLNVPGGHRMDFRFVLKSSDPCTFVRKRMRILDLDGKLLSRPVDLPEKDGILLASFYGSQGSRYIVDLQAMVRVPGDSGLPLGQQLWAVAYLPSVYEGFVPPAT